MTAYYNEFDPKAAAWLRELIKQGHIADGVVDDRSIIDVTPDELREFTQCHFFAGIGVWSYALRSAGWTDDRPVWTGSCPCQPFSAAGSRGGFDDQRHLWPHWHHLISQCRPSVVFGEQVASKDGLGWLDLVHADMEATGYAVGAADLCAAGIGAPHIRQRLWFVGLADAEGSRWAREPIRQSGWGSERGTSGHCEPDGLADASGERHDGQQVCLQSGEPRQEGAEAAGSGGHHGLADADDADGSGELGFHSQDRSNGRQGNSGTWPQSSAELEQPSPTNGFWRDADWLFCRDGKWRPVEPGTSPLAHGSPARVGRLRGYGNAIAAPVAQTFIESVMEILE